MMKKIILLCALFIFASCYQNRTEDDELDTIPITNNPQIIPRGGNSPLPQMGQSPR